MLKAAQDRTTLAIKAEGEAFDHWTTLLMHHISLAKKAPGPQGEIMTDKELCQHKWKKAGFTGPYWAYECELCGEEKYI